MNEVTPVGASAPFSKRPVFRDAMSELNRARPRSSKSFEQDPRFFASGLGKCHKAQQGWMLGIEQEPLDDVSHRTFETGEMIEAWLLKFAHDHLANLPEVDRVEEQVIFRFTTKQGVTVSGRADLVIYWLTHPDTGKPEIEVVDFKSDSEYGFKKKLSGEETAKVPHVLQVLAGCQGIKVDEWNGMVRPTRWRLAYIRKGAPTGWQRDSYVEKNPGGHVLDTEHIEYAYGSDVGREMLIEEMNLLAGLVDLTVDGEASSRWVPFVGMKSGIRYFNDKGKGVYTDDDDNEAEYWACAGYCSVESWCKQTWQEEQVHLLTSKPKPKPKPEPEPEPEPERNLWAVPDPPPDAGPDASSEQGDRLAQLQAKQAKQREEKERAEAERARAREETPAVVPHFCHECGGAGEHNGRKCPTCEGSGLQHVPIEPTPIPPITSGPKDPEDQTVPCYCTTVEPVEGFDCPLCGGLETIELKEGAGAKLVYMDWLAAWKDAKENPPAPEPDLVRLEDCETIADVTVAALLLAFAEADTPWVVDEIIQGLPPKRPNRRARHLLNSLRTPIGHDRARPATDAEKEKRRELKESAERIIAQEMEDAEVRLRAARREQGLCQMCDEERTDEGDYCSARCAVAAIADKTGMDLCAGFNMDGSTCDRPIERDPDRVLCPSCEAKHKGLSPAEVGP